VVHPARLSRPTPCNYRNDGECDVPQYCSAGDYNDCGDFADCADHHCPSACKCEPGSAANGILTLGSSGMCEAHCSKEFGGKRFCGSGAGYMDGDFIDCTGCGTGSGGLTAALIDPCACTTDGNSGGRTVSAIGCKNHFNENDIWCYTTGGPELRIGDSVTGAARHSMATVHAWHHPI